MLQLSDTLGVAFGTGGCGRDRGGWRLVALADPDRARRRLLRCAAVAVIAAVAPIRLPAAITAAEHRQ